MTNAPACLTATAQKALDKSGLTPQQKVEGLKDIIKDVGVAMLTTRSPDGKLASRPMAPAAIDGLVFSHYLNTDSGKTDDVQTDPHVNISFYNPKTTDWVSVSGQAKINTDREKVKKHWSKALQAWFDKKDDVRNGTHTDPRVALLDVTPDEIRWFKAESSFKQFVEVTKAAVTGGVAATGTLVIISQDEVSDASDLLRP